jgi:hypothetical protein
MLYDLKEAPPSFRTAPSWEPDSYKHYGLLNFDGTTKAAAKFITPNASLKITRVPSWASLFKPFPLTVFIPAGMAGLIMLEQNRKKKPKLAN